MDLWQELHPNEPAPPSMRTEFPKWVNGPNGNRVLVRSRAEMNAVMDGEDIAPEPKRDFSPPPPPLSEKATLQLQAQNLGVKIDRRWSVKKLQKIIQENRQS